MAYNLIKHIERYLCRKKFHGHSSPHWYSSEASVVANGKVLGTCARQAYFRYTNEQGRPNSVYAEGIFELGKNVENMIAERFKGMGILEARSIRFQNAEYNISGELDMVCRDPETGLLFGVECKSFYGYNAGKEIMGTRNEAGKPKGSHLMQTLVYAREFMKELDHFKVYYEERGDGSRVAYDVRVIPDEDDKGNIIYLAEINGSIVSEYTVTDVYNRYKELQTHITNGTIPDRDFEIAYTNERIESEYLAGTISESKYTSWKKVYKRDGSVKYNEANRPGDYQCKPYCPYVDICYGE